MTDGTDGTEVRWPSVGSTLFAQTFGVGRCLILLHGSGLTTHDSLAPLARELASDFHVVTPDIRGYGRSVCADPAMHTWEQYSCDVVTLLDHLDVRSAVVAGWSLGAPSQS